MTKYNIFSENIYGNWEIDEKKFIDIAKKILKYYLSSDNVYQNSCLNEFDNKTISYYYLY